MKRSILTTCARARTFMMMHTHTHTHTHTNPYTHAHTHTSSSFLLACESWACPSTNTRGGSVPLSMNGVAMTGSCSPEPHHGDIAHSEPCHVLILLHRSTPRNPSGKGGLLVGGYYSPGLATACRPGQAIREVSPSVLSHPPTHLAPFAASKNPRLR